jgi:hypothetical protein
VRRIITLLALGSLAAFAFVFGNEADDIYPADLLLFLVVLALILLVQAGGLIALHRLAQRVRDEATALMVTSIAAALLLAANAYVVAFITFDAALWVRRAMAVAFGIVMLAILLRRRWQPPAIFIATAYVVLSFGLYGYTRLMMASDSKPADIGLRVKSTRNVYFIGNESLSSPKAFREIYGVSDLPHVNWLKSHGFRVLDSAYSADHATTRSWSRILGFGNELDEGDIRHKVAFNAKNTTFGLFSRSGYRTQFIYKDKYFGVHKHSADFVFPDSGFGQCAFLPNSYFYFLCDKHVVRWVNRYVYGATPISPEVVKKRISLAAADSRPWLTVYHHPFPFHSAYMSFDQAAVRAFKARMVQALPEIRRQNFETIIAHILRTDPSAVIVTFGDHGPGAWSPLFSHVDLNSPNKDVTRSQILEDRFGVLLAVYPADFCTHRIFEGSSTLNLSYSVIKCLNGDDNPSREDIERSLSFYPGSRRDKLTRYR